METAPEAAMAEEPHSAICTSSIVAAVENRRRLDMAQGQDKLEAQFDQEHDLRQAFRRLIDPGIMRPNSRETALTSLKTLSTIAENILKDPTNERFQKFKPTNSVIKKTLIDVPGALEYAIAMGFRAEVHNFQPFYVHLKAGKKELRVGSAILSEALDREAEKDRRTTESKAKEKEAIQSAAEKVKMNYRDDRKEKLLRDHMEQERRMAKAASAIDAVSPTSPSKDGTGNDLPSHENSNLPPLRSQGEPPIEEI